MTRIYQNFTLWSLNSSTLFSHYLSPSKHGVNLYPVLQFLILSSFFYSLCSKHPKRHTLSSSLSIQFTIKEGYNNFESPIEIILIPLTNMKMDHLEISQLLYSLRGDIRLIYKVVQRIPLTISIGLRVIW